MYYKLIFNIMNNILSLNSVAKLQLIFDIRKFLFVFLCFCRFKEFFVVFGTKKMRLLSKTHLTMHNF